MLAFRTECDFCELCFKLHVSLGESLIWHILVSHISSFQPSGALAERELEPRFGRGVCGEKAGFQLTRDRAGVWNDGMRIEH